MGLAILPSKGRGLCDALKFLPSGAFPCHTSFLSGNVAVLIGFVPKYHSEPFLNQVRCFSPHVDWGPPGGEQQGLKEGWPFSRR